MFNQHRLAVLWSGSVLAVCIYMIDVSAGSRFPEFTAISVSVNIHRFLQRLSARFLRQTTPEQQVISLMHRYFAKQLFSWTFKQLIRNLI